MNYPPLTAEQNAAVLLPLLLSPLRVVLHVRAKALREHAGEIALPGGRPDSRDTSLLDTALRETKEELGISPEDIVIVGQLFPVPVVTGKYLLHPFVGIINTLPAHTSPEIERLIVMDLECYLRGEETIYVRWDTWRGAHIPSPFFRLPNGDIPYGATAAILFDLLNRMAAKTGVTMKTEQSDYKPWGDRYKNDGG